MSNQVEIEPTQEERKAAREVVRQCVERAKRVDCECEDLWCFHWESRVAESFARALAGQREACAKIVESQADPNWNQHYRQIAAAVRAGRT